MTPDSVKTGPSPLEDLIRLTNAVDPDQVKAPEKSSTSIVVTSVLRDLETLFNSTSKRIALARQLPLSRKHLSTLYEKLWRLARKVEVVVPENSEISASIRKSMKDIERIIARGDNFCGGYKRYLARLGRYALDINRRDLKLIARDIKTNSHLLGSTSKEGSKLSPYERQSLFKALAVLRDAVEELEPIYLKFLGKKRWIQVDPRCVKADTPLKKQCRPHRDDLIRMIDGILETHGVDRDLPAETMHDIYSLLPGGKDKRQSLTTFRLQLEQLRKANVSTNGFLGTFGRWISRHNVPMTEALKGLSKEEIRQLGPRVVRGDFSEYQFGAGKNITYAEMVTFFPNLVALDLNRCVLTPTKKRAPGTMLPAAEWDEIWRTDIAKNLSALGELPKLVQLRELNVGSMAFGDLGAAEIAKLTGLRKLKAGNCKMTHRGAAHLAKLTELRELDLRFNRIEATGVRCLTKRLRNLETLTLSFCGIDDTAAPCLRELKSLRYLDLEKNSMSELALEGLKSEMPEAVVLW